MIEDIRLLLNSLNESALNNITKYIEDEKIDIDNVEVVGELLRNKFFPFMNKYNDNIEFLNLLSENITNDNIYFMKFILSPKMYNYLLNNVLTSNKIDGIFILNNLTLTTKEEIQILEEKGLPLTNIMERLHANFTRDIINYIYEKDRQLAIDYITKNIMESIDVIANEYKLGNKNLVHNVLSYIHENEKFFYLITNSFIDNKCFDIDFFIEILESKKIDKSFIKDIDLQKKLIKEVGSKALIFCYNPNEEIVELAKDFDYSDYTLIDGDYKKSNALLIKFLKNNENALLYADEEAIKDNIIPYLEEYNIDKDFFNKKIFTTLTSTVAVNKYLISKNIYDYIKTIDYSEKNIEKFNFLYECFEKEIIDKSFYGLIPLPLMCLNKDWSQIEKYSYTMNEEVAKRVIELGFSLEDYFKYSSSYALAKVFLEMGHYEVLFKCDDYRISNKLDKYSNLLTYEKYLELTKILGEEFKLSKTFIYKFVKEGHYEVFKNYNGYIANYELENLGLNNLTYEKYLELPDYIKNIPSLKEKYLDNNMEYIEELLRTNPTPTVINYAMQNNMSFNDLKKYDIRGNINSKVLLHYLRLGEVDILDYIGYSIEYDDELLSVCYQLYKANKISKNILNNNDLKIALVKYCINLKDYSIFKDFDDISDIFTEKLIENDITFDEIIKYNIINERILLSFITKENEENIIELLVNKRFYKYIEEIIVKMYKENYTYENINRIVKNVNTLNIKKIIDLLDDDLTILDRLDYNLYQDKISVDILLNELDKEKIKKDLMIYSIDENMRCYIIKKMVERGYSEFISYYNNIIDKDVLKRAIMSGYYPNYYILDNNKNILKAINNLEFNNDELNYMRAKINDCPILVMYFEDLLNNTSTIETYLKKAPEIILYCNEKIKNNFEILKIVCATRPDLFSKLKNISLNNDKVIELIKINKDIAKYLNTSYINEIVVNELINIYPNIIDYMLTNLRNEEIIYLAIDNGYIPSENTSINIFPYLMRKDKQFNIEYLKNRECYEIINMISNAGYNNYLKYEEQFDNLFDFMYEKNSNKFIQEINYLIRQFNLDFKKKIGIKYSINLLSGIPLTDDEKYSVLVDVKKQIILSNCKYTKEDYNSLINIFGIDIMKKIFIDSLKDNHNIIEYINSFNLTEEEQEIIYNITINCIENSSMKEIFVDWLYNNYYLKDANDYSMKFFDSNPEKYAHYINNPTQEFLNNAKKHTKKYPALYLDIPELLNDKETIINCIRYNDGYLYNSLTEDLKNDYDILFAYVNVNSRNILNINKNHPKYKDLCYVALKINGTLFKELDLKGDLEALHNAISNYPEAYFYADEKLQTKENFSLIKNYSYIKFEKDFNIEYVKKVFEFNLFSSSDIELFKNIIEYVSNYNDEFKNLKSNNKYFIETFTNNLNSEYFKTICKLTNNVDLSNYSEEFVTIITNANIVLSSRGKVNTLDKNPIFSYDLIKYVYPNLGLDNTLDLLKFNTPASLEIINEIKNNNIDLIKFHLEFSRKHKLFDIDRAIHFEFRDFNKFKDLVKVLKENENELTNLDIEIFKKIIINSNKYNIKTLEELRNYDEIVNKEIEKINNTENIEMIKDYLSGLFGYDNLNNMIKEMNSFQLDNFALINEIKNEIVNKQGKETIKDLLYTPEEIKVIFLMKRIIESNNIEEIKEYLKTYSKDENIDFREEVSNIITKLRKLYNIEYNLNLSKLSNFEGKKDPISGVTIIDLQGEKFNFLVHRIYNYDKTLGGYDSMIEDPSLWFKLEGASTLSTSSISDKCLGIVPDKREESVLYLFNELPENFMLFMYGRDLYVEHGGFKLEPKANSNSFTDINSLNQTSGKHRGSYNEVAGFREGMIPCALACLGDVPNEETIRAAKYFSQVLNKDVPIIKLNLELYESRLESEYESAKIKYKENPSFENLTNIFYDGISSGYKFDRENEKIDYCIECLNNLYKENKISFKEFNKHLIEIKRTLNKLYCHTKDGKQLIKKVEVYISSLSLLGSLSKEEQINLETAHMGESGIMYKLKEDEETYLIKPAVDKEKHSYQPFRAEIQASASVLGKILSPETTVDVNVLGDRNLRFSKQELIKVNEDKKNLLDNWCKNNGELEEQYKQQLLSEYVVDFLLCNFDCYSGNFIIDENDCIRGIDKEQSFRFLDSKESLDPSFKFTPNGSNRIPIYKILLERYEKGEIDLDFSIVNAKLDELDLISDEEYKNIFRTYAESLNKENSDELLNKIVERKHKVSIILRDYINKLQSKKEGGLGL